MNGFSMRPLGKTGLPVSPLGIGGGSGIESEDLLYAFDRGVNYFFYSSDLHHYRYGKSAAAIRTLCKAGSAVRDKVVLATVSYITNPEKIMAVLVDQMGELGVDYIDVFHWGWVTEKDDYPMLFETAQQLKAGGAVARMFRENLMQIEYTNQELLNRGLVRYVGTSFHSRQLARQWMNKLDVMMLRYNLAHLGVEFGIFPLLAGDKQIDPGVVAFNVGHEGPKLISTPPAGFPSDCYVPSIPDCYRYALSNPYVDVVLTGVENRSQLDEALAILEKGPLSAEEQQYFREYGNQWRTANQAPTTAAAGDKFLNWLGFK